MQSEVFPGYELPNDRLLPPRTDSVRIISLEREALLRRYKNANFTGPAWVMVAGGGTIVLAAGIYDFANTCIGVGYGSCGTDSGVAGLAAAVAVSGAIGITIGGVWLSKRIRARRLIVRELERLDETERFRVERISLGGIAGRPGAAGVSFVGTF